MFKEVNSLVTAGFSKDLLIVGLWTPGLREKEKHSLFCRIWRLRLSSYFLPGNHFFSALKYMEWCIRILWFIGKLKVSMIHAHSLKSLPAAVALKYLTGASLIYDAHELETERNGLSGSMQRISRLIELLLIGFADATMVVSDSIAEHYRARYPGVNPVVVRNIPKFTQESRASVSLRKKLGLQDKDFLFLYLGGLVKGRGVEALLDAFSKLSSNHHLVFIGGGVLEETVLTSVSSSARIHWVPLVASSEVLAYAKGADVGLCFIEDICLSYRYSLPNKFFEYLLAGLPVAVYDLPEQKKIVEKYDCGWVLDRSASAMSAFLKGFKAEAAKAKQAGVFKAVKDLDWRNEERIYLSLCRSVLFAGRS
jgi:glycosyltransferase involved in cell wall biosynthesis